MDDLLTFSQQVDAHLAASRQRPKWSAQQIQQFMAEFGPRRKRYEEAAANLIESAIRPRLEVLGSHFDNAMLAKSDRPERCACWFGYSNRYPVSTKVEFAVEHDEAIENLIVTYELHIMPLFIKIDAHDRLAVPLADVSERTVGDWVEKKLLGFVDTYLQLDRGRDDFDDEAVVDPVCGMRMIRSAVGATTDYRGHTYFFCTEDCRQRFAKEPLRYVRFEMQ